MRASAPLSVSSWFLDRPDGFLQTIYFAWVFAYFGQNSLLPPKPCHVAAAAAGCCWPIYGHGYYKLRPGYWFAVCHSAAACADSWQLSYKVIKWGDSGCSRTRTRTRTRLCVTRYKCISMCPRIAMCVPVSAQLRLMSKAWIHFRFKKSFCFFLFLCSVRAFWLIDGWE